jgi:DNA polymerase elongation subunit (family B)
MPYITEMMCLTKTCANDLMFRGQQKKTWNQLVYAAHHQKWLLDETWRQTMQERYGVVCDKVRPYMKSNEEKQFEREKRSKRSKKEKDDGRFHYKGGYVKNPPPGFFTTMNATKDFNALYPSVEVAFQLDWSTWVNPLHDSRGRLYFPLYGASYEQQDRNRYLIWTLDELKPELAPSDTRDIILVVEDWTEAVGPVESEKAERWLAYQHWKKWVAKHPPKVPHLPRPLPKLPEEPEWKRPVGKVPKVFPFVQNRESLLPPILTNLLDSRNRVKALQKIAEKEGKIALSKVHNARQLALKLSANASYGFTGASEGFHGGLAIGAATCLLG